jgi:hypothetical protein
MKSQSFPVSAGITADVHFRDLRYDRGRDYDKATRIYVNIKGESIFTNLIYRTSRPVELYRKAVMMALPVLGLDDCTLRWSQKAGCSCPCSPGFILLQDKHAKTHYATDGSYSRPVDIWVTIEAEAAEGLGVLDLKELQTDDTKADLAAFRAAQLGLEV